MGTILPTMGAVTMSGCPRGCYIRRLTAGGLEPVQYAAESLSDAVQYEPRDGVYTVSSTDCQRLVLRLTAHFDRLEESAAGAGIPLRLERERIRAALRHMMDEAGFEAARFRITAPREEPQVLILSMEDFTPPSAELRAGGVSVVTRLDGARRAAYIKGTDWLHERQVIEAAQADGVYEVILQDGEGRLLEGLGSNFYAIAAEQLWTAVVGVLRGIAQGIVLEVAPAQLPTRREGLPVARRAEMTEAFLTSSSRGIIPIIAIDGEPVGTGRPGAQTLALQAAYDERAAELKEAL